MGKPLYINKRILVGKLHAKRPLGKIGESGS
jgi:hypothetical protein